MKFLFDHLTEDFALKVSLDNHLSLALHSFCNYVLEFAKVAIGNLLVQ